MAHNTPYTPGSGGTLCAYDQATGGAYPTTGAVPAGVIYVSPNSTTAPTPVTATNGFYVQPGTATTWAVSASALPLPAGASTSALQTTANTSLASILAALGGTLTTTGTTAVSNFPSGFAATQSGTWTVGVSGSVAVTGTFYQATQPISASSLPLPTGAALEAGNLATIAGKDFATQTTLAALNAKITACNTGAVVVVTLPATPAGTNTIGAVNFAQSLDATNDAVRVRVISGVLDDGAGNSLTIKTVRGSATASGVNAVVAAVTSKRIRVISYSLQADNANGSVVAANFQDDAGTPVVLSQSWQFAAREGISKPLSHGPGFYFQTTSGQALKLNLGSALTVAWEISYVEV